MTRRDFQLISATLKSVAAPVRVVTALADALAGTNPKFDRDRFMRSSGVPPSELARMAWAPYTRRQTNA